MAKEPAQPLDENTRRYYLDVMGIQCWQSIEPQQQDISADTGDAVDNSNTEVVASSWPQLEADIQQCASCSLHKTRKQALAGRGNRSAELMFIVLSPDARDDDSGVLCSGAINELFSKMLAAIDIAIDDVYITSLLKCAVPHRHTVSPKEIRDCSVHLQQQVELVRPKHIIVLGETAVRCLLQKNLSIDDFRALNPGAGGQQQPYQFESVPVFVSYSPAELLQQAQNKRKAWADLQQLQKIINVQQA